MKTKNTNIPEEFDLKKEAPFLSGISKKSPFSVPEGFFAELSQNIENKTINKTQVVYSTKRNQFIFKPAYYAIAAAIALFIAISVVYFNKSNGNDPLLSAESHKNSSKTGIEDSKNAPETPQNQLNPEKQQITSIDNKSSNLPQNTVDNNQLINNNQVKPDFADNNSKNQKQPQKLPNPLIPANPIHNNTNPVNPLYAASPNGLNGNSISNPNAIARNNKSVNDLNNTANARKFQISLGNDTCSETPFVLKSGDMGEGFTYQWSTGEKSKYIKISKSGVYSVTATKSDQPNIVSSDEISIKIIPAPELNNEKSFTICSNENITLYATESETPDKNLTYKWAPVKHSGSFLNITGLGTGTYNYNVIVTGCKNYNKNFTIFVNDCNVEIPNVFTPNGDGYNDNFVIKGIENYNGSELLILDRNGKTVYQSINYQNDWNGESVRDGVFYYILKLSDNQHTVRKGMVTICRINQN